MSPARPGEAVAGEGESQSELLLLLLPMSGDEMTFTVLAALSLFLPTIASSSSRHVGSSLRCLDLLVLRLPLVQFMLMLTMTLTLS